MTFAIVILAVVGFAIWMLNRAPKADLTPDEEQDRRQGY